ncbi:MAG: SDR family oxidoreductase [Dehalococcoidia bacterium]|nr:SDR family oxidoreductase [Dehalococcoidia bacterium]
MTTQNKPVLILGATSTIARYSAMSLAKHGHPLYLASRNTEEQKRIAADITIRYGVSVRQGVFDADNIASHAQLIKNVISEMGGLWGVVYAVGYMGKTSPGKGQSIEDAASVIARNLTGAVSVIEAAAAHIESQNSGFIIAISSVAGDRGRRKNYIYGSAKAGLATYIEGLRHRMSGKAVRIVCIKPGLVDTPMTYGMRKGLLMASPAAVGERIAKATEHGHNTIYVPFFWRYIMLIIRVMPEFIFKRLNF